MATIYDWDRILHDRARTGVLPLRLDAYADDIWHGPAVRVPGIGRDAVEVTPFDDMLNVEAINGADGVEAMLTIEQAEQLQHALGEAIAAVKRRRPLVAKEVPTVPGTPR